MRLAFLLVVLISANSLGQEVPRFSVVLKSPPAPNKLLVFGVQVKEVILTGSKDQIIKAIVDSPKLVQHPSCASLLLSKDQIFESLTRIPEPPDCTKSLDLCISLPSGFDFVTLQRDIKRDESTCSLESICLSKEGISASVQCGDLTISIATSGKVELSSRNGKLTRTVSFGPE